jgi:predicted methyltransferase
MSRNNLLPLSVLVLALAGCASQGSAQGAGKGSGGSSAVASAAIAAAVADPARPEADRARDADRKPAELIAFAGIKPGTRMSEFMPGGGYFTRIFSKVVGEKGAVYALVPARAASAPANAPDFAAPINALAADPNYRNVHVMFLDATVAQPKVDPVDLVWTSLNYHDMHNRPNADLVSFNKRMLDALKPGGLYIVVDHAAQAGSGARDTGTLHRIDPALVKSEVLAAGFEFVEESNLLRNPADPKDKGVREALRGKTDQFIYKFRKPKK